MNMRIPFVFAIALFSAPNLAFTVDKSFIDTTSVLGIPTVSSMTVGQKAWIEQSKVSLCVNSERQLQIENAQQIELTENLRQLNIELSRVDAGVDIQVNSNDLTSQNEKLQIIAYKIANAKACTERIDHYLPIDSVLGVKSQSDLLALSQITKEEKTDTPKRLDLDKNSDTLSTWRITIERDELEQAVSVTFSQPDNDQHALFEAKCEASTTSYTAVVNDFLGDKSQDALLRFGKEQYIPVHVNLTDNSRGFVLTEVPDIKEKILNSPTMSLRYTNFNQETKTLIYSIEGLLDKLNTHSELCGSN
ncbi:hypothetical protein ACXJY6_04350 [Vibrio sp. RC27]